MLSAADLRIDILLDLGRLLLSKIALTILAVLGIILGSASIMPTHAAGMYYPFAPPCSTCAG
jgi:hypothetical protein